MSVSLLLNKGERFDCYTSECIKEIPVSSQTVWNNVWEKAVSECKLRKFVCCSMFDVNEIPTVLAELDIIYDWVHYNGGDDTDYIRNRILDLKEFFNEFYLEHKNSDYWFDLG